MATGDVDVVDDVDMSMDDGSNIEERNRLINEEYKIWKKNSPFLYDMLLSTALEWPTLTTQWFPDVKDAKDKNYTVHRVLIGTHTSDDKPNYLEIAELEIPKSVQPNPDDYDEERGEIGGYGGKSSSGGAPSIKFNVTQRIDHPGEVNKARYQPKNPDIIATLCVDGRVLIFDRTKHSLEPTGTPNPQMELVGHKQEGFGLSWCPKQGQESQLVTGSEDTTVLLWDLNTASGKTLKPLRKFTHHAHIVNDVQYHPIHPMWVGTVSDDLTAQVIDLRVSSNDRAARVYEKGHSDAINAIAFHPRMEMLFATASADKTIGIWDMRYTKGTIHVCQGHNDAVTSLAWNPRHDSILGSGGYDRRVLIWDISRVGDEQAPEEAEDGPPELLFMHGGHTNHLADFSWNLNMPWLVCSASEDNLLQIWRPADSIVQPDGSGLPMNELGPTK